MIKITFEKQNGKFIAISCKGHADYNTHGEDIVCASVSAITQSLALGIIKVLKIKANYKIEEKTGLLELGLPKEKINASTQVLFETAYESLMDLESGYPKNIKVEVKDLCL